MPTAAKKRGSVRIRLGLVCVAAAVLAVEASASARVEPPVVDGSPADSDDEATQVEARLLADTSTVAAGGAFNVGILLQIRPDWHVYWKNPGSSGVATHVAFTLPDGFEAGPLRWPVPRKFTQPGDIVGYGYADSVMLLARITPPDELGRDKFTIKADVSWLACRDKCIPGKAELELTLPVAQKPRPADRELFTEWAARLPVPAGEEKDVAKVAVSGPGLSQDKKAGRFEVNIQWRKPPGKLEFFPAAGDALLISGIAADTEANVTVITAAVKLLNVKNSPASMEAVVACAGSGEQRKGIEIEIPITSRKETEND